VLEKRSWKMKPPQNKGKKKCPYCGDWFYPAGITNHLKYFHRDKNGMPLILKGEQATINEPTDPPCENELELAQERIKNLQLQLERERIKVEVLEGLFNEVLDRIR
jgi:hypothetical protein